MMKMIIADFPKIYIMITDYIRNGTIQKSIFGQKFPHLLARYVQYKNQYIVPEICSPI